MTAHGNAVEQSWLGIRFMGITTKTIRAVLGAILIGGLFASPLASSAQADIKYLIDREVLAGYQKYLDAIGTTRPGAFAITEDGHNYWYVKCRSTKCSGSTTYSHDAKQGCEQEYNQSCVILAVRRDARIQYEVRD